MAENAPPPSSLPPPPQPSVGAPGQHQYDNGQGGGQGNPAHMPPPPLPPVVIPQNTNAIPTAITSPMSGGMMSPGSAGGFVRRAAPEPNKRALYVGGLDPRVTEDVLRQIFETTGHVQNVKIIPDKNVGAVSTNFSSVSCSALDPLSGKVAHRSCLPPAVRFVVVLRSLTLHHCSRLYHELPDLCTPSDS